MVYRLVSFFVFVGSISLWLTVWSSAVGFENLRHDRLLWLGIAVFAVLSLGQVLGDMVMGNELASHIEEKGATDVILSVTASLLLAVSLLVSLSNVGEGPPILRHTPFYSATLATFLWIVVGVFTLTWLEALEGANGRHLRAFLRLAKRAAFFQAIGWSAVAIVSLFYLLERQKELL